MIIFLWFFTFLCGLVVFCSPGEMPQPGAFLGRGGIRGKLGWDFQGMTPVAHRLPAGNQRDGSGSAPWDT